jgi:hypothetical protein
VDNVTPIRPDADPIGKQIEASVVLMEARQTIQRSNCVLQQLTGELMHALAEIELLRVEIEVTKRRQRPVALDLGNISFLLKPQAG